MPSGGPTSRSSAWPPCQQPRHTRPVPPTPPSPRRGLGALSTAPRVIRHRGSGAHSSLRAHLRQQSLELQKQTPSQPVGVVQTIGPGGNPGEPSPRRTGTRRPGGARRAEGPGPPTASRRSRSHSVQREPQSPPGREHSRGAPNYSLLSQRSRSHAVMNSVPGEICHLGETGRLITNHCGRLSEINALINV